MDAWFNRGICKALESAAVADLEARLERTQRLCLVDEANPALVSLFVYRGDWLLGVITFPSHWVWVYDFHADTSMHRVLVLHNWSLLACTRLFAEMAIEPCRGLTRTHFGRDGLGCLLSPADLGTLLRGLLRVVETRCTGNVRQANTDAVRQLAAALDVALE
jgi:hypothetical protein